MGVFALGTSAGFLLVWVQGLPGPHHGAYAALASLWNIRTGLWWYVHLNGHLPPASATNAEGEAIYSWRVEVYQIAVRHGMLMPTSEKNDSESIDYNRHQAWNSPDNLRLQRYGVRYFEYTPHGGHADRIAEDEYSTYYKAITGPGTAFDPVAAPRSPTELPSDLILVVRVERSDTHWMEPGDLSIEHLMASDEAKQLLSGKNGYAVLFADGRPWVLSAELPFSDLCKFMTIAGAQSYDRDTVLAPYRIP